MKAEYGSRRSSSFIGDGSVQGLELDSMVLVGPLQFGIFCDSCQSCLHSMGIKEPLKTLGQREIRSLRTQQMAFLALHPCIPSWEGTWHQTFVLLLLWCGSQGFPESQEMKI